MLYGYHVEQHLSGSVDNEAAQTRDSWLIHFLAYIKEYELTDKYLSHSSSIVDNLLSRYDLLLFMGYGCTPCHIKSGTVLGYLTVINAHYAEMGIHPPFVAKSKSKTVRLLADAKKFELKPDHREPLSDKAFDKMQELASLGSFTGFRSLAWDIVALGCYGGFRQQEYAMDHKTKVKYFNTPKGQVVRTFTIKNILFQDRDRMVVHNPLLHPELIKLLVHATRFKKLS
jgi:hypothetical protein